MGNEYRNGEEKELSGDETLTNYSGITYQEWRDKMNVELMNLQLELLRSNSLQYYGHLHWMSPGILPKKMHQWVLRKDGTVEDCARVEWIKQASN